jgi:L-histidine N-alpha-methyltransferase
MSITLPSRIPGLRMFGLHRLLPADAMANALRQDAHAGLTAFPKWLPPKWFYDAAGSELFEKITGLPEYYPARAERAILATHAGEIADACLAHTLVELGSGSSAKTRLLLDALGAAGTLGNYIPVDVSEAALTGAGRSLDRWYPHLPVLALLADVTQRLELPAARPGQRRMFAFLGSTIGNLLPAERRRFLARLRDIMHDGDTLLLGTDLVKDPATLVAAYDDSAGVTAAFNKNVLAVLNRELRAHFDPDAFEHVALWNPQREWIEMRLRSAFAQTVAVPELGLRVEFSGGEQMRTEVSAKFRRAGVQAELAAAGFTMTHWWTDPDRLYALSLSAPAYETP